jgi:hypothetical protein
VGAIVTTRLGGWTIRVRIPAGTRHSFSSLKRPHQLWGPPSLLFKGTGVLRGSRAVRA